MVRSLSRSIALTRAEFTETLRLRVFPIMTFPIRFIALFDLQRGKDGLWRITRRACGVDAQLTAAEEDNWPSDVWRSGIYLPGFGLLSNLLKVSAGWFAITTGALMARTGLLG